MSTTNEGVAAAHPREPTSALGPEPSALSDTDTGAGTDTGTGTRPRTRWCTGTRLLVGATAAWAVLLVLHVLLAGRWWPWLVAEAVPPLTLVAVPLLLLAVTPLARPVRRWLSAVLVVLLLAGAYLADLGPAWGEGTDSARGTTVKVFAWSTDYWRMTDDTDDFYAFLRRQNADVYLLQEYLYWEGDQPVRIDDTARLRREFPGYSLSVEGELLTLSRLPVVAEHHRSVSGGGTDWYWKGSKTQRTDLRVDGRTVSFYNVHLPVPFRVGDNPLTGRFRGFLRDQYDRRERELRALRTDLADNPHPSVVAGDFNSPWMGRLLRLGAGSQAHRPEGSLLPALSWPVSDYPLPRLWRLDWLLTTGDLAVPAYRFHGGEAFSDHVAQEIRVTVPDDAS
ncbi:endonuclease/exonuclease/phosphatase family protein [Streptomyces acidicola]|uniref:Tat pathway signal protein n=1 Tax=Streptomyces acidicola TaxID=2596892 RepID=A0A5N8WRQ6_9ACTN|nr:endonuclease/exonuclease/phosphatase family protein [Streptomyces acidicola]MPY49822.1 Tat pathway signal protein [Streptomyces acidicola]